MFTTSNIIITAFVSKVLELGRGSICSENIGEARTGGTPVLATISCKDNCHNF